MEWRECGREWMGLEEKVECVEKRERKQFVRRIHSHCGRVTHRADSEDGPHNLRMGEE